MRRKKLEHSEIPQPRFRQRLRYRPKRSRGIFQQRTREIEGRIIHCTSVIQIIRFRYSIASLHADVRKHAQTDHGKAIQGILKRKRATQEHSSTNRKPCPLGSRYFPRAFKLLCGRFEVLTGRTIHPPIQSKLNKTLGGSFPETAQDSTKPRRDRPLRQFSPISSSTDRPVCFS